MGHWKREQQRQMFEDIGAIIGLLVRFGWRQFGKHRQTWQEQAQHTAATQAAGQPPHHDQSR